MSSKKIVRRQSSAKADEITQVVEELLETQSLIDDFQTQEKDLKDRLLRLVKDSAQVTLPDGENVKIKHVAPTRVKVDEERLRTLVDEETWSKCLTSVFTKTKFEALVAVEEIDDAIVEAVVTEEATKPYPLVTRGRKKTR